MKQLLGEPHSGRCGAGGRVLWLALGASFFFLTQAGEMFVSNKGRCNATRCVRRRDVAFFRGSTQLYWTFGNQDYGVEV